MFNYIEHSRRTTLKEAIRSLYGLIGFWVRKNEDKERYVGYLFFLMERIIEMADYIRLTGADPTRIKELTDGIPAEEAIKDFYKERNN